jgi:nitroimidazol reductase NimA-like FMN-containing flavoprotein (pyridoxamine 5'-phosphate oxidase superfamily)
MTEAWLEALSAQECLELLRENVVGRIAFVADGRPAVLPVNYRLVETAGISAGTYIALRTRPGNVIDHASMAVAFEIDGIDPSYRRGWSVLVRGTLYHVDSPGLRERFDPRTWLAAERDAWLVIHPDEITGRRLHPDQHEWAFHSQAYI